MAPHRRPAFRGAESSPTTRARGRGTTEEPADPRDRLDERVEFLSAMQELSRLSIRMQQTVIVRSQVRKQIEVAEILGVTTARVNYLLRRASEKLDEMATRRAERSGRSRRLEPLDCASSRTTHRNG